MIMGEMLFNTHREQVYHSQREGLSVCQRRHPCPKERGDQLLRDQGDPLSKDVKNQTLNTHRFWFVWTTERGNPCQFLEDQETHQK